MEKKLFAITVIILTEFDWCWIKCVSDNWRFWLENVFSDNWRFRLLYPYVGQLTCRIFDCLIIFVMIIDVVPLFFLHFYQNIQIYECVCMCYWKNVSMCDRENVCVYVCV